MKNENFIILAVDIQEKKKTVKKFVDKTGIPFPVLMDVNAKVASNYGIRGTPAHYLIDKKGIIRAYAPGYKNAADKKTINLIRFLMDD